MMMMMMMSADTLVSLFLLSKPAGTHWLSSLIFDNNDSIDLYIDWTMTSSAGARLIVRLRAVQSNSINASTRLEIGV